MNNTEAQFEQLGLDAMTGVHIMNLLHLTMSDLADPMRFSRLESIVEFLKQYPEDHQRFLVSKVSTGKPVDRLLHVWEYTQLLRKRGDARDRLNSIQKRKKELEATPDPVQMEKVKTDEAGIREQIKVLKSEIGIYEKR